MFTHCDRCGNDHPGQLVRHDDGAQEALCFTCWNPIRGTVKVLNWINKHGKLQF
ncbi:hypothetical protein EV284_3494 [Streptomyces sp. BK022]|uniref:hypothetical protein n=1 Tax=Streptomyces sp. BK022 TaxID=2512123 RepID=UPI0010CFA673|nr:hypothetical protein [Streptomyces sp. BK022]RZU36011.1 hypothetical protein EV284_3494 [Streptomyces sp. BK022]